MAGLTFNFKFYLHACKLSELNPVYVDIIPACLTSSNWDISRLKIKKKNKSSDTMMTAYFTYDVLNT